MAVNYPPTLMPVRNLPNKNNGNILPKTQKITPIA
jgi:hypothetical protein